MRLKVEECPEIRISPFFFWEKPEKAFLKINTGSFFRPSHVTTRLSLKLLCSLLSSSSCDSLLDIGCGTGIFALFAAKMGIQRVVGVDIDYSSAALAIKNVEANGVVHSCGIVCGTVASIRGTFECVIANLPFYVLESDFSEVAGRVTPGGQLIVSGFQDVHLPIIVGKASDMCFRIKEKLSGDDVFYGIPPSGSFTWMAVRMQSAMAGAI